MKYRIKNGLALPLVALTLAGCMQSAPATDPAAAMMSRAEQLGGDTIPAAQLEAARADGVDLKSVEGSPAGDNFAAACDDLYASTRSSAALVQLDASHALTMAKCSGFMS